MGINPVVAGQILTAAEINQLPVVISQLATGAATNTTAVTVIGTFTIPASDPTFPGGYYFKIFGNGTAVSSPTVTIRMNLNGTGGTLLLSSPAITWSTSPASFGVDGFIGFAGIGAGGSFGSDIKLDYGFTGTSTTAVGVPNSLVSINTTVANTITISAQWGTANASNSVQTLFGAMYRL